MPSTTDAGNSGAFVERRKPKLDPRVVLDLVAVGRAGVPSVPPTLRIKQLAWRRIMVGRGRWETVGRCLSEANLRDLIRGLVLFSQTGVWSDGSVSPVIYLHRIYASHYPDLEPEISSWVVENRTNQYEPYGTLMGCGARSLSELEEYRALRARMREEGLKRDAARQKRDKAAKARRGTERLANAVRRGDLAAIKALLSKGAEWRQALPDGGSLMSLARQNGRKHVAEYLRERGVE